MQLLKLKDTGEIVYFDNYIDILTIYHINLKYNYPSHSIDDFDVLEITDKTEIEKIKTHPRVFYKNDKFEYEPIKKQTIDYELQIDKTEQLQCQILAMQKKINDLTQIVNDTKNAMTTLMKT